LGLAIKIVDPLPPIISQQPQTEKTLSKKARMSTSADLPKRGWPHFISPQEKI